MTNFKLKMKETLKKISEKTEELGSDISKFADEAKVTISEKAALVKNKIEKK